MTRDQRERFVIAPHHPDRLRRPPAVRAARSDEAFRQALAWNVFRTLELVSPSFWLRRLHVRVTGEPSSFVPPQIACVHLWRSLPLPPIQRIDGGRPDVVVDVLIETEHAVWTLVADSAGCSVMDGGAAAAFVDAGGWFAGVRTHYCAVIETGLAAPAFGLVLQDRYSRSRDSARLRSASRGPGQAARARWGVLRWSQCAALLRDCCQAPSLAPIERALAGNGLDWLTRAGIEAEADDDTTQCPVSS